MESNNEENKEEAVAPSSPEEEKSASKWGMKIIIAIIVIAAMVYGFMALTDGEEEVDDMNDIEDARGIDDALETTFGDDEEEAALPAQPGTPVDTSTDTQATTNQAVKTFTVTGTNFAFSEDEIRVKQGDTVRIEFSSTEGFHDWVVDEFDAATEQVRPGTPTSVEFVADQKGTFEYYCSVGTHRQQGMVGNLIVE